MKLSLREDHKPILRKKLAKVLEYYMDDEMRSRMMIDKTFSDQFEANVETYITGLLEGEKDDNR